MSMKKGDDNPIGPLILEDLKETAEGLYRYLMKGDNKSEESVAKKITQYIHEHFCGGYNINLTTLSITFWWIMTSFKS